MRAFGGSERTVNLPGRGFNVDDIVLTYTRTFYTIYGDIFAYLCILLTASYALFIRFSKEPRPLRTRARGFTLIEMMIVVAIVGLLSAIAIPNFIKARETARRDACIANLKQIQVAVQVWATDTSATSSASFTTADIVPNYLKRWPKENGADYPKPDNVSATPVCPNPSFYPDHTL